MSLGRRYDLGRNCSLLLQGDTPGKYRKLTEEEIALEQARFALQIPGERRSLPARSTSDLTTNHVQSPDGANSLWKTKGATKAGKKIGKSKSMSSKEDNVVRNLDAQRKENADEQTYVLSTTASASPASPNYAIVLDTAICRSGSDGEGDDVRRHAEDKHEKKKKIKPEKRKKEKKVKRKDKGKTKAEKHACELHPEGTSLGNGMDGPKHCHSCTCHLSSSTDPTVEGDALNHRNEELIAQSEAPISHEETPRSPNECSRDNDGTQSKNVSSSRSSSSKSSTAAKTSRTRHSSSSSDNSSRSSSHKHKSQSRIAPLLRIHTPPTTPDPGEHQSYFETPDHPPVLGESPQGTSNADSSLEQEAETSVQSFHPQPVRSRSPGCICLSSYTNVPMQDGDTLELISGQWPGGESDVDTGDYLCPSGQPEVYTPSEIEARATQLAHGVESPQVRTSLLESPSAPPPSSTLRMSGSDESFGPGGVCVTTSPADSGYQFNLRPPAGFKETDNVNETSGNGGGTTMMDAEDVVTTGFGAGEIDPPETELHIAQVNMARAVQKSLQSSPIVQDSEHGLVNDNYVGIVVKSGGDGNISGAESHSSKSSEESGRKDATGRHQKSTTDGSESSSSSSDVNKPKRKIEKPKRKGKPATDKKQIEVLKQKEDTKELSPSVKETSPELCAVDLSALQITAPVPDIIDNHPHSRVSDENLNPDPAFTSPVQYDNESTTSNTPHDVHTGEHDSGRPDTVEITIDESSQEQRVQIPLLDVSAAPNNVTSEHGHDPEENISKLPNGDSQPSSEHGHDPEENISKLPNGDSQPSSEHIFDVSAPDLPKSDPPKMHPAMKNGVRSGSDSDSSSSSCSTGRKHGPKGGVYAYSPYTSRGHLDTVHPTMVHSPLNVSQSLAATSNSNLNGFDRLEGSFSPGMQMDSGVPSVVRHRGHFVVVAIDFGTTFSGYALSFVNDPDNVHMMRNWEGGDPGVINQKTPTTILLTPDGEFDSFGFTARDRYHNLVPEEARSWLYFERFKMLLHHDATLSRDTVIRASNGQTYPALRVFALALRFFKEHALQQLTDQAGITIINDDVRWVITVPAIWKSPAKQFMRQAAYEADLVSPDCPDELLIALEPEAASIYCRKLRIYQLVPDSTDRAPLQSPRYSTPEPLNEGLACRELYEGTRYMVVDCGGGTVDITVHELGDHTKLKELYKASGGPYGATAVDDEFINILCDIFGHEFISHYKTKYPVGWVNLMINFESRKRSASPFKSSSLNIALPFTFIDYFKKQKGGHIDNVVKRYGNKDITWSSEGMLRMTPHAMKCLFVPVLEKIKFAIGDVLNNRNARDLRYLFLVGGFAESPILQHEIKTEFSAILKVIIPTGVSLAILKGAVLFGLDPTIVNIRRSRLTYGVGVLNRFDPSRHPSSKFVHRDGVDWCTDVFDTFVKEDQPITLGDTVIRSYTPAKTNQLISVIHIYSSDSKDVPFITDPGVRRCGTLCLDLSDLQIEDLPSRREIQTRMMFGDTEIKVSSLDVATGRSVGASIDFLNK